tara:strand:+ start:1821 stop:2243 length:423 start_codon:yes stop_codon:yes gene_type:complete
MKNKSGKVGKWIQPTINWNAFATTEYPPVSYMIDEMGFVHIRGLTTADGSPDYSTVPVFNLPPSYTPDYSIIAPITNILLGSITTNIIVHGGNVQSGSSVSGVDYKAGDVCVGATNGTTVNNSVSLAVSFHVGKERLRQL